MRNENRPQEAASESATTSHILQADDRHAAAMALYDTGFAHGQRRASVDLAREWLHADARRWTDSAVRLASAKGTAWSDAIRMQAEAVDE